MMARRVFRRMRGATSNAIAVGPQAAEMQRGFMVTRTLLRLALPVTLLLVAACSDSPTEPDVTAGTFITTLPGSQEVLVVVVAEPGSDGLQKVKAYLCDGEPGGDVEWFGGTLTGNTAALTSRDNAQTTLSIQVDDAQVTGVIKLTGRTALPFVAAAAKPGEGVYEITVNASGVYAGVSLAGDVLAAGTVMGGALDCDRNTIRGTVTTASGQSIKFGAHNLTTCTAAELTGRGHTSIFATSGRTGGLPDTYAAVVQRRGVDWVVYGRATTFPIRSTTISPTLSFGAGLNFIGLNMNDCCP
jgi:hypothetical protein